jgi:hypothetical protein
MKHSEGTVSAWFCEKELVKSRLTLVPPSQGPFANGWSDLSFPVRTWDSPKEIRFERNSSASIDGHPEGILIPTSGSRVVRC